MTAITTKASEKSLGSKADGVPSRHHAERRSNSTASTTPRLTDNCWAIVENAVAWLISGRVKASRAELFEALRGRISTHHRFMLKLHLGHVDALAQAIAAIEKEVGLGLEPFRHAARLLSTMPGLSEVSAHVVVAEIGIDMSRFATPGHLLSCVPAQR